MSSLASQQEEWFPAADVDEEEFDDLALALGELVGPHLRPLDCPRPPGVN